MNSHVCLVASVLSSSALESMTQEPETKGVWGLEGDPEPTHLVGTVGTARYRSIFRDS